MEVKSIVSTRKILKDQIYNVVRLDNDPTDKNSVILPEGCSKIQTYITDDGPIIIDPILFVKEIGYSDSQRGIKALNL